jgi:TolB protein
MFSSGWRRGTIVGLAAAGAAVVVGAGTLGVTWANSAAGARPAAAAAPRQHAAAHVVAQQRSTAPQAAAQPTGAAQATAPRTASSAAVPWRSVGPGWVLDTYSAGTRARPAPTTLYLVSPGGAKYRLLTWPVSATPAPTIVAWAGSKTEALFALHSPNGQPGGYGELNLATGKMTRVAFASAATTPLGYTLPSGAQILGISQGGQNTTIARYTQSGALVKALVTVGQALGASYSPDGAKLAVPALGGLLLVSNAGGVPRKLPVTGAGAKATCEPVRWWNATTVLASCGRLWLVPASGARPSALTPVRNPAQPPHDYGDLDAWQLPSGLYLQSAGACGTLELNRQAANGSITRVTVPGMTDSPAVVTAYGAQLLIGQLGCEGSGGQLAWFNPATGAEHWLFRTGAGPSAVAYNSLENGDIQ